MLINPLTSSFDGKSQLPQARKYEMSFLHLINVTKTSLPDEHVLNE